MKPWLFVDLTPLPEVFYTKSQWKISGGRRPLPGREAAIVEGRELWGKKRGFA